jgi:hypothetical protein
VWCDHLPQELNKMTEDDRKFLVQTMVQAHDRLCDNPDYSFGVDMDDKTHQFVAHFRTPAGTEVFLEGDFPGVVTEVCKMVMNTTIPKVAGSCTFGDNGAENLGQQILRACTDMDFRKAHHDACPCSHS